MDDTNTRIRSKYFWLMMWTTYHHASDGMFSGEMSRYKWSAEIFCLNKELEFQPSSLSYTCPSPLTTNYIDVSSIPQGHNDQIDQQATSHIAIVTIKSQDGDSVLRSIVYNGAIPTAHMTYSSPTGRKLDSGDSLLKVFGMANGLNYSQEEFEGLSILYPIPINNYTKSIGFFLNSVKIGNIVVESLWEEFPIFDHLPTMYDSSVKYADDHGNNTNWLPEISSLSNVMALSMSDTVIVYTTDQFQSLSLQKILHNDGTPQKCPNSSQVILPLKKYIIHLGKAGVTVLHMNSSGKWTTAEDFSGLVRTSNCMIKAKVSPRLYSASMIVMMSESRVFVSLLGTLFFMSQPCVTYDSKGIGRISTPCYTDEEPGAVELKELIGVDEMSACDYLSLSNNVCNIVDVAFDPSACCTIFVLVFDTSNSTYFLLKHSDVLLNGHWSILTTFTSTLPLLSMDVDQIVVNLQPNSSNPVWNFTLNGMSTLSRPDGVIYMWGDVLLVFDIQSSTIGWIPRFLLNGTASRDMAIQFNSADKKGIYSILTKNGVIWTGISHPFERPYKMIIRQLRNSEQATFVSTFFDWQDKLFALVLLRNGSVNSIRREEILLEDESDSHCLRTYNCQKLLLLCDGSNSSLHADVGSYSRIREFYLKPPVLTEKGKSSGNIPLVYSKKALITYLSVLERFFNKQDTALKQHRKYLHFKNSLPNAPMLYLHEGIFKQTRTAGQSAVCFLPEVVYLDKDERFFFTVVLEHPLSANQLNYDFLRLALMQSDKSTVKTEVTRDVGSFDVRYHITLTGQQTSHKFPGELLNTVALLFYPWNPHMFTEKQQNASCCWRSDTGMAFEKNLLVKVGCPPGRRLVFDYQRSQEILQQRGQAASQDCFTSSSGLPCFTTSEFVAAFYIEDLVTGERKAFEGNYTLSVVAGGVGYLENIVAYSDSEKEQYNYKPGDNRDALIWNVLSETSIYQMQDATTGNLIFNGNNPSSIVFECRMDSPCGSIPLTSANPSEYYFEIEVSNNGVDSSTNCDYTVTFPVRLIGMQLSPRIHLYLMLVTLSIIMLSLLLYYFCRRWGNVSIWKEDKFGSEDGSISPPRELRDALARRRKTLVGITSSYPRSARRASTLSQSFNSDSDRRLTHSGQRS